jgi:protein tyrosine phosphatase (PTP) superfamily phosphohydrolase (DUF442 family)
MNLSNEITPAPASFRRGWELSLLFGVLVALFCFGWLAEALRNRGGLVWDNSALALVHKHDSEELDRISILITQIGDLRLVLIVTVFCATVLLLAQRKRDERFLARCVVGAAVIILSVKAAFHRLPPHVFESAIMQMDLGSPSAHSMGTSALVLGLALIAWPTRWRWPVILAGSFYAVSVAVSRVYLGAHQTSDVLAAWALTLAWVSGLSVLRSADLVHKKKGVLLVSGILASFVAILAGYISGDLKHDNLRMLVAGQAYRSGQMDAAHLTQIIERYNIKSVLNLRGENPTSDWHRAEIATADKQHVIHYDRALSSGRELTLEEMDELVTLLMQAPKPVLIHCQGGADRSGLVSALYRFAIEGRSPGKADKELSIWNGHVPLIRPKVTAMDNSFWWFASNRPVRANLNLQAKPLFPCARRLRPRTHRSVG